MVLIMPPFIKCTTQTTTSRLTQQLRPGKHPAVIVGAGEKIAAALRRSSCTPTAVDAALAAAGTSAAVVGILEWAGDARGGGGGGGGGGGSVSSGGSGGGSGGGGEDDAAAAVADATDASISKTFKKIKSTPDAGGGRSSSSGATTTPGEALARRLRTRVSARMKA